ncbi:uncharacterized protein LOC141730006 isoform X1 [Zonotrichia albicollis]|uniref:uncharacterized protein LOC141730006 isoform X1 n=1 Tax=Zonotrichia albicollis TaxID=44394 RepID=UPI003D811C2A
MAGVSASASLLALLSAGAGASPRAHCGVPPDSQLPQHPQPPAALSPPPARVLLGRAGGGGPAEVLLVPAMGGLSSRNYSCEVCPEGGAVPNSSARLHIAVPMPVDNATITPSVLEVTLPETGTHRDTVAAGVGGALLFLLLLVAVIVAWHWWHRVGPPQTPWHPQWRILRRRTWSCEGNHGNPVTSTAIYTKSCDALGSRKHWVTLGVLPPWLLWLPILPREVVMAQGEVAHGTLCYPFPLPVPPRASPSLCWYLQGLPSPVQVPKYPQRLHHSLPTALAVHPGLPHSPPTTPVPSCWKRGNWGGFLLKGFSGENEAQKWQYYI